MILLLSHLALGASLQTLKDGVPRAQSVLNSCSTVGCDRTLGVRAAWWIAVERYVRTGVADGSLSATIRDLDPLLFADLPDVLQRAATEPLEWAVPRDEGLQMLTAAVETTAINHVQPDRRMPFDPIVHDPLRVEVPAGVVKALLATERPAAAAWATSALGDVKRTAQLAARNRDPSPVWSVVSHAPLPADATDDVRFAVAQLALARGAALRALEVARSIQDGPVAEQARLLELRGLRRNGWSNSVSRLSEKTQWTSPSVRVQAVLEANGGALMSERGDNSIVSVGGGLSVMRYRASDQRMHIEGRLRAPQTMSARARARWITTLLASNNTTRAQRQATRLLSSVERDKITLQELLARTDDELLLSWRAGLRLPEDARGTIAARDTDRATLATLEQLQPLAGDRAAVQAFLSAAHAHVTSRHVTRIRVDLAYQLERLDHARADLETFLSEYSP